MDQSAGMTTQVQSSSEAGTHLSGKMRVVARALWCALVLLTLATFVAGLSPYVAYLHHLCQSATCNNSDQLTLVGLRELRAWGLPRFLCYPGADPPHRLRRRLFAGQSRARLAQIG